MRPVILKKLDGGKFEISIVALKRMLRFIQDTPEKTEAGGVLLGRRIIDTTDIVVDEVTVPMAGDRRRRNSFRRGRRAHQAIIDRVWRESSGTCGYLGEWHTHPEESPTPSSVDLRDWNRILKNDVFDGDYLYFIIVGYRHLKVWEAAKNDSGSLCLGECSVLGVEDVGD